MKRTALLLSAGLMVAVAHAEDDPPRVPMLRAYEQECSACHVAYPPGFLPPASWSRLMHDLPHHFGTDASLDPATAKTISSWLEGHASAHAAKPPQERITRSAWFQREHREVPSDAWQRPAVRGASNCAACHAGASQGDYGEHQVRIPQ